MTEPLFAPPVDAPEELVLAALREVPGYPFADPIDRKFARMLLEDFPTADIPATIRRWSTWLLDNPDRATPRKTRSGRKKKPNHRLQLRNWLERERSGRPYGGSTSGAGPSTGAHSPEAYGATSEGLERW